MKSILTISTIFLMFLVTTNLQAQSYEYAYVFATNKGMSKKIKVEFDFGETSEQLAKAKKYDKQFSGTKSIAKILNYMSDKKYEIVQTVPVTLSGRYVGLTLIMRKEK